MALPVAPTFLGRPSTVALRQARRSILARNLYRSSPLALSLRPLNFTSREETNEMRQHRLKASGHDHATAGELEPRYCIKFRPRDRRPNAGECTRRCYRGASHPKRVVSSSGFARSTPIRPPLFNWRRHRTCSASHPRAWFLRGGRVNYADRVIQEPLRLVPRLSRRAPQQADQPYSCPKE
jgi:hypothetical protein